MNQRAAVQRLSVLDRQGRHVFARADLAKVFHEDEERTLQAGLDRLVRQGILLRVARGAYVYALSASMGAGTLEQIAKTIRRGEYSYVSLESALSEYGIISQVPLDRLTVMTTGRKGEYKTPFGTIEFTHTGRRASDILDNTQVVDRPLRMASPAAACRDLRRVGRNTHLIEEAALDEYR